MDIEVSTLNTETEDGLTNSLLEIDCNNVLKELNEIQVLDEEKVYSEFLGEYNSKYKNLSIRIKNALDKLMEKCNQYCHYNIAKLVELLKALGYSSSSSKYGIEFDICRSIAIISYKVDYPEQYPFKPQITNVQSNSICINHDSSQNKGEPSTDFNTYKKNNHYDFTKKQKLSFSEQIEIVDKLIEDGSKEDNHKSFFSKLFGK